MTQYLSRAYRLHSLDKRVLISAEECCWAECSEPRASARGKYCLAHRAESQSRWTNREHCTAKGCTQPRMPGTSFCLSHKYGAAQILAMGPPPEIVALFREGRIRSRWLGGDVICKSCQHRLTLWYDSLMIDADREFARELSVESPGSLIVVQSLGDSVPLLACPGCGRINPIPPTPEGYLLFSETGTWVES